MCRIVGFFDRSLNHSYDRRQTLRRMRDSLFRGGPDSKGEYFDLDDRLALGHRRLSIIDLSENGRQPWVSGSDVIVYNGEFYNYAEVRDQLSGQVSFSTESDTEVLIKGIQTHGQGFIHQVRGMFGFAIWSEEQKRLTLCRDRVGVKPLYWYRKEGLFMFASELRAFHEHPCFDKTIDQDSLATYLTYGYVPAPDSIYKHVKKCLPGTFMHVDQDLQITTESYWSAGDVYQSGFDDTRSEDDLADELEQELLESLQLRMVADVPVGIFLSGGVDSSLVTAMLQKHSNQQISTFTIGFEDKRFDESGQAKRVADHVGTRHHERICTESDFVDMARRIPDIVDEPFADASIIPTLLVSEFAKQHVKVSLSADGGDELFGGYTKYLYTKKWNPRLNRIPPMAKRLASKIGWTLQRSSIVRALTNRTLEKRFSNVEAKTQKFLRTLEAKDLVSLFDMASSYTTPKNLSKLTSGHPHQRNQRSPDEDRILGYLGLMDIEHYLEGDILTKVDRATMHVALEGRDPLLDQRLVEFGLSLRDDLKVRKGVNKYLLRKILDRYVPPDSPDQVKRGFAIPTKDWLNSFFKDSLLEMAQDDSFHHAFQFSADELQRITDRFISGKPYADPQFVWSLFVLYHWHRRWNVSSSVAS